MFGTVYDGKTDVFYDYLQKISNKNLFCVCTCFGVVKIIYKWYFIDNFFHTKCCSTYTRTTGTTEWLIDKISRVSCFVEPRKVKLKSSRNFLVKFEFLNFVIIIYFFYYGSPQTFKELILYLQIDDKNNWNSNELLYEFMICRNIVNESGVSIQILCNLYTKTYCGNFRNLKVTFKILW